MSTSSSIRDRIEKLEIEGSTLEPGPEKRQQLRARVMAYAEEYLADLPEGRAFGKGHSEGRKIGNTSYQDVPIQIEEAIDIFKEEIDPYGINAASGGHLGYIPGGGLYAAALGDFLAAVTNHYGGIFFGSPGAVQMEQALIREIAGMVGYPEDAEGNLASGGSIANLIGLVSARDYLGITSKNIRETVAYASPQAHHCIQKAVRIAGMGEMVWRELPLDEQYKLQPHLLLDQIQNDLAKGLRPSLILATAGTTDTGAIDPLDALADIAEEFGMWLHVDAAYGGFFHLLEEERHKFRGMHRSDSVVLDPHKGLFLPYGLGVVLVQNREAIANAHRYRANYMQDADAKAIGLSPADLSPELTKHFRALRLWLPLRLYGLAPFRAQLREKLMLARYFAQEIKATGQFDLLCPPELSVVAFHYRSSDPSIRERTTRKLLDYLHEDGRVFVSSSTIDGEFVIRAAILSFRTHLSTVDLLLSNIRTWIKEELK